MVTVCPLLYLCRPRVYGPRLTLNIIYLLANEQLVQAATDRDHYVDADRMYVQHFAFVGPRLIMAPPYGLALLEHDLLRTTVVNGRLVKVNNRPRL